MTTNTSMTDEQARQFWKEAREKANSRDCNFSGWRFPADPDKNGFSRIIFKSFANFSETTFEGNANFSRAHFEEGTDFSKATCEKIVCFSTVHFQGETNFKAISVREANFERAAFYENTFFDNASFEFGASFKGVRFLKYASFQEVKIKKGYAYFQNVSFGQNSSFKKAVFNVSIFFEDSEFGWRVDFESTEYHETADFKRCIFHGTADFKFALLKGEADFEKATFESNANFEKAKFSDNSKAIFREATFELDASFLGVVFDGDCDFWRARFKRGGNFINATFKNIAYFAGVEVSKGIYFDLPKLSFKSKPFQITQQGETAYRLAKQVAQEHGDYRRAGGFHYAEQCAINSKYINDTCYCPCSLDFYWGQKSPFLTWGEFIVGRMIFGYGEKPTRPFVWGIIILFLFAVIYFSSGGVGLVKNDSFTEHCFCNVGTSLYFSIVTFTTLGYGDLKPIGGIRFVAGTEALIGAAMMALFIVSLARKFTR